MKSYCKLLTKDGVVHAQNCLEKVTRHFLWRTVCSKNRFHARDITRASILDVDFSFYELLAGENL